MVESGIVILTDVSCFSPVLMRYLLVVVEMTLGNGFQRIRPTHFRPGPDLSLILEC